MIDHRALQRALFRVQLDPSFADRVFAADEAALASLGLGERERAWLLDANPVAVRADKGAQRCAQLVGNLTTEFPRSVWALDGDPLTFVASEEFHAAIAGDEPLPLAFGAWLARRLSGRAAHALVELERAMARARRSVRSVPPLQAGEVGLAAPCRLLSVPAGTHAWASSVGQALDAGRTPPAARLAAAERELLLLQADADAGPSGRRDVVVEPLEPAVARLLRRAQEPFDAVERAAFAEAEGARPEDLEVFVQSLVDERVLVVGPTAGD